MAARREVSDAPRHQAPRAEVQAKAVQQAVKQGAQILKIEAVEEIARSLTVGYQEETSQAPHGED